MGQPGIWPDSSEPPLQFEADEVLEEESAFVVQRAVERAPEQCITDAQVEEE